MQHANDESVLGNFDSAKFQYHAISTTFFRDGERFLVNIDGPDGELQDFEVKFTFGVYPLQQYLVELPGGRLQALGVAWDARPVEAGGQKWFHLYPDEKIDHKDDLHWTRLSQNWNHMCAECHSTNLRKNYHLVENSFNTTWTEINVACEACHGPGSRHVAWANKQAGAEEFDDSGLAIRLDERKGVVWEFNSQANTATRNQPRTTSREIESCAHCHSRRSALTEDYRHGKPLMDTHLPALLTEDLYYPDGQIKEEDYEYGSFVQSRMFHKGVTCSDCHDPHSGKLRAPGNETCLQCHRAEKYNSEAHHFHPLNSSGADCAGCHMPTATFMVVDARHDHSIRIPRPDLSVKLSTPNACNSCHTNKDAAWADARLRTWLGPDWSPGWHFGETLHEAFADRPQIGPDLAAISLAAQIPDIARATAASVLANYLEPVTRVALPKLLADTSPLVRQAALEIVDRLPDDQRWQFAGKLLSDPIRAVRMEAGRVLTVAADSAPTLAQKLDLDAAVREYVSTALANAEHPQSHVNLGLLYQRLGQAEKAEAEYRQAVRLDPTFAAGYVNLADLYRLQEQDQKAEDILLTARSSIGEHAAVEHALGLLYARTRRMPYALESLALAARLQPYNPRYSYVYAVALNDSGDKTRAINILEAVHDSHPYDRDALIALVTFSEANGNTEAAKRFADKLAAIDAGL